MFTVFRRSLRMESLRFKCLLLSGLLLVTRLSAQTLPPGFTLGKVQDGYDMPMGLVFSASDKQLFVWERKGLVWVSNWNGITYVRQPTPVLDLREEVANWGEVGLMSLCLDPNFSQNGLIYLFYGVDRHHLLHYGTPQYSPTANSYSDASIGRVTRYRLDRSDNTLAADYTSRKVLLGETKQTGVPLLKGTHLGGTLLFGRDGSLLISTGDNASWAVTDLGSAPDTYYKTALADSIIRPAENVGAFRAQLVDSHCGKILRIDPVTGDGLASNPFYNPDKPRSARSRVWAMGFRNPFKMSLQPNTGSTDVSLGDPGTLLVGDVGWFSWEEISVVDRSGFNGGWPLYEGIDPSSGYYGTNVRNPDEPDQPTFESLCQQPTSPVPDANPVNRRYTHARPALDWLRGQPIARVPTFEGTIATRKTIGTVGAPAGIPFAGNCAIGGVFYTGSQFPDAYKNTYFFADFGKNWIKNIVYHQEGSHWVHEVREFAAPGFSQSVIALDVNPLDGSLYFIDTYDNKVGRIGYGGNRPPVASITTDTTYGRSPLTVHFDASASSDPDGNSLSYEWDFGDGNTATGATPVHTFSSNSTQGYLVTLSVRDEGNLTDTQTKVISINNQSPPTVRITSPVNGTQYPLDRVSHYTLQAEAADLPDNPTDSSAKLTYQWQVVLRHNTHEHRDPVIDEVSPTVAIEPTGCDLGETYYYLIRCTVTDKGGLTTTDSVKIFPDCQSGSIAVQEVVVVPQAGAVQLKWTNPTVPFDEILVAARPDEGFTDKPSSTTYTADADFTGNGSPLDGGKVVYRGNDTTVTVTGLTASSRYFLRIYTRAGEGWNGGVEVSARPLADASCEMFTLKAGSWDDPSVWSCNRVPTSSDAVQLKHHVNIPVNYVAFARTVNVDPGVGLLVGFNAVLKLNL